MAVVCYVNKNHAYCLDVTAICKVASVEDSQLERDVTALVVVWLLLIIMKYFLDRRLR
jgi:hypothetical protein